MTILPHPAARFSFILASLLLLSVPIAQAQEHPSSPPPAHAVHGVVFVLDGSGRLHLMAEDLAKAAEACLPLDVREVNWSHGFCRIFSDLKRQTNHDARGEELASAILTCRACCPEAKVFVVTHSAGAAVVIAAAKHLPPGAIDRIIMLAPAVSPCADIQSALRASCNGVDVFYSHKDMISRALALTGTADGKHVFSAGAHGFADPCDAGLRQHGYTSEMGRSGHHGGHYGWTKAGFLRDYVIPLLTQCD
jgi:hypothetical protein